MAENKAILHKLATLLKELRQQHHLSQEQFAAAIGMDRSTYAGTERGRHDPKLSSLWKFADGFNMTLAEFFAEF